MPLLKKIKFRHPNGAECKVKLDLNDTAIMDDCLEMEVGGKFRQGPDEEWIKRKFTVRFNAEINAIEILHDGEVIGTIVLDAVGDFIARELDELPAPEAWEKIREMFEDGGALIDELIQSIPVPDPIFGCLIKAGLSTAIGQLLECNTIVPVRETAKQRIWELLRCLGFNSLPMISKFTFRTLRCAVSFGWG